MLNIQKQTGASRAVIAATLTAVGGLAAPSIALANPGVITDETPFKNGRAIEPLWRGVKASVVTVNAPLPASLGARTPACDNLRYLRYRHKKGPVDPQQASSVLVVMPGIFEGASAMDAYAQNVVSEAERSNSQFVEVWLMDRRGNCLEDMTGIEHINNGGATKEAFDYYLEGKELGGKKFRGWNPNKDEQRMLGALGLKQTLEDYRTIITTSFKSQELMQKKVVCSGHSLGGMITGLLSSWDFDGNPATKHDAGSNYCGGYLALDTYILNRLHPAGKDREARLTGFGYIPTEFPLAFPENHMELPVINPQVTTALAGVGALAARDPKGELNIWNEINLDKISAQFPLVGLTLPLMFSKDIGQFLNGGIRPNRWRMTNEAGLGFLLDDNFFGMSGIAQVSVGFLDGGPVEDKHFPLPNGMGSIPVLSRVTKNILGAGSLAFPSAYQKSPNDQVPIYTWRNFNEVDKNKWTDKGKENTDIRAFARSVGALPLDFLEKYFPWRLNAEVDLALFGERSTGDLKHVLYEDGPSTRPSITFLAEDGPMLAADTAIDLYGEKVLLPGYQHLDPLTAAPTQHDGTQEQTMARTVSYLKRNFSVK